MESIWDMSAPWPKEVKTLNFQLLIEVSQPLAIQAKDLSASDCCFSFFSLSTKFCIFQTINLSLGRWAITGSGRIKTHVGLAQLLNIILYTCLAHICSLE